MPQQVSGFSKLSKTEKINWLITNYFGGNIHAKVTLESYWNSDSELQQLHDEFIENTITNFYMVIKFPDQNKAAKVRKV